MQVEQAETVAAQALGWMVGEEGLFDVFLGASGVALNEVKARAAEPEFLAAVLDFLLQADSHVTAFCDAAGLPHDAPLRARAALPGGAPPDWT